MTETTPISFKEASQMVLAREFALLRRQLGDERAVVPSVERTSEDSELALDTLLRTFELSVFERDLLLLCAGCEMDALLAAQCGELTGRPMQSAVTFSFAMSVLREPHWSALSDGGALRRYRLITMEGGHGVASSPLRIDERVLQYLAGVNHLDPRLESVLVRRYPTEWMHAEHFQLASKSLRGDGAMPNVVLHLCGDDALAQENVAALLAYRAGRELYLLRHDDTPGSGPEMEQFLRLWARESMLLPGLLMLQWENEAPSAAARQLVERLPTAVVLGSREAVRLHRPVETHEVNRPTPSEQHVLWQEALDTSADVLQDTIGRVAEQFRFSAETIGEIAEAVRSPEGEPPAEAVMRERLWTMCRMHSRPRLQGLAERIVPQASWGDLVLPEMQMAVLRQIVSQARHRMLVNERWGFADRNRRGLGLSTLFAGPSGVGKTLAAEVLAHELELDLYRIDLSAVVSKYIGETEKNLKQVFDAAEMGGVLLLFDEADALLGKRSDVKDSHDRYANIEVAYLLQRMENYQGLAVLTTNLKAAMDRSFQRRLRFSVDFPFPDYAQRLAIWQRIFPDRTPTQGLDPARLAMLNMTGGNIRNIALNAAFLAADEDTPVSMEHLLRAAKLEALKVDRPLAEAETRGWV